MFNKDKKKLVHIQLENETHGKVLQQAKENNRSIKQECEYIINEKIKEGQ